MTSSDQLPELLALEPGGDGRWSGVTPSGHDRPNLFGGIVAAQALRAGHLSAGLDRQPHSLHAYFLRSGRFGEPLLFRVDETRSGRSFSARRVEVSQQGGPILTMIVSFKVPESGDDYQVDPSGLGPPAEGAATTGTGTETGTPGDGPFELVDAPPGERHPGSLDWSAVRYWARARQALPDDPGIHACAIVAMGDLRTAGPPLAARADERPVRMTSLDYALWFHRPTRADGWLLFDLRPGGNGGARGLTYGVVHDAGGVQAASLAMELMLRVRSSPAN